LATAVALALVNIGLAATIVGLMGGRTFAPLWAGLIIVAAGAGMLFWAVSLWRRYLTAVRGR
jgi:hypothetical protein